MMTSLLGKGGKGLAETGGKVADSVSYIPVVGGTASTAINAAGDATYVLADTTKRVGAASAKIGVDAGRGVLKKAKSVKHIAEDAIKVGHEGSE